MQANFDAMGLQIERVPTLGDNYSYVIACDETGEAAIVDAPEFDPVVARADEMGVRVTKILSTHHHPDHSAANPQLAAHYGAPVYGHVSDAERLPASPPTPADTSPTTSKMPLPRSPATPCSRAVAVACSKVRPK